MPQAHGFEGPFELTDDGVTLALNQTVAPGVFVLGHYDAGAYWHVDFIDRSDQYVTARLRTYVGYYPSFMVRRCGSSKEAYDLHCELFHLYGPDQAHPCRPEGTDLICRYCPQIPACEQTS